jgi:hypothetical protein
VHALKELYPQNERLFCSLLGVQDAKIEDLIQEARLLSTADSLDYISNVFLEMEKLIKDDTPDHVTRTLKTSRIFPVRPVGSHAGFNELARSDSASAWFIADCTHFQRSFQGKIPLLAFDVKIIGRMKKAIRRAGVENRRLSSVAKGSAETEGLVVLLQDQTAAFKRKVSSILR